MAIEESNENFTETVPINDDTSETENIENN